MDIYIARQPIFTRSKQIFAYELLFRDGTENSFPGTEGNNATSRVLSNTFFTSGIEQITGGKRAFINFTRELLIGKIPLLFPSQITTVEVLENVIPDGPVIESCRELSGKGYTIALDDFEYTPPMEPLIEISEIIKVDFAKSTREQIRAFADRFTCSGKKLLAEKVETNEEFEEALKLGYSYFQGYFFSKPQLIRRTDIPALKVNILGIMSEVGKENYRVGTLQKLIEQDVGISYKLLRYLNSPFYRRVQEVSSIRQAIVLLGEKGIKQFLSVIFLAEISQDKPDELLKSSIIRARICEGIGMATGGRIDPSELFTLGLFSHIDAILDNSMEDIMKTLPLTSEIKSTLTGSRTVLSTYLDLTRSYQQARWDSALQAASTLGLAPDRLPEIYWKAIQFADSVCMAGT